MEKSLLNRIAISAISVIAGVGLCGATPAIAMSSTGAGVQYISETYSIPAELAVLRQVNDYRAAHGLGSLMMDHGFTQGARQWAQYLNATSSSPYHPENGYFFENVAYAQSPDRSVGLWSQSQTHNAILLEPSMS